MSGKFNHKNSTKVQLLNSADFDGELKEGTVLFLVASKQEVVKCEVGNLVDSLMKLSDTKGNVEKGAGRMVLVFEGWDDDKRELWDIPEVVAYFKLVNSFWSYWFHFCDTLGDNIGVVCYLLCPLKKELVDGKYLTMIKSHSELKNVLLSLFDSMNNLYEQHGFSEEENVKTSKRVIKALDKAFG